MKNLINGKVNTTPARRRTAKRLLVSGINDNKLVHGERTILRRMQKEGFARDDRQTWRPTASTVLLTLTPAQCEAAERLFRGGCIMVNNHFHSSRALAALMKMQLATLGDSERTIGACCFRPTKLLKSAFYLVKDGGGGDKK